MKASILGSVLVIFAAGAVAAGCSDEPMAAAPEQPKSERAAPLLQASPGQGIRDRHIDGIVAASTTPLPAGTLNVTVSCSDTGNLYSMQRFDCTAHVSGGSGTGYNFTWTGNATEYYDYGGTSKAWYPCQYVPNSYGYGYLSATAVAFDSNGSYQGATYNKQPCDPR
ncbi:MAG TPA: hypothetical protein VEX86_21380 [Longimicrobium sp.]|nr:hypothetical protein [Longimicrobium sp.]